MSNDGASGNRGVILHVYGSGRLKSTSLSRREVGEKRKIRGIVTYKTIPESTGVSESRGISFPFSSCPGSIRTAQSTVAISMNSESLAACFPTQARLPKPYVLCPSSRVSAGPGISLPCSSRNLSGLKLAASGPYNAGSWWHCQRLTRQKSTLGYEHAFVPIVLGRGVWNTQWERGAPPKRFLDQRLYVR
jgi:hypothetical protein